MDNSRIVQIFLKCFVVGVRKGGGAWICGYCNKTSFYILDFDFFEILAALFAALAQVEIQIFVSFHV